jgi:glycoprotein 3-alpha-L-fucosyltransferase
VDKVETLKRYKFSLAFENSNEEDYVTEKFFQSLVTGNSICYNHSPKHQCTPTIARTIYMGNLSDCHMLSISKSVTTLCS